MLPHTEQVCFVKTQTFGIVRKVYVDIKDLEKIDYSEAKCKQVFVMNSLDKDFIWRDAVSKEEFVFGRYGTWGKEALEHRLLN